MTVRNVTYCLLLLLLVACNPVYSPYIYDQTADLKTQVLTLLSKGTEPYAKYQPKVELLKNDLESIRQQEQMRKRNDLKIKQWNVVLDSTGYLLYGTLAKWQRDTIMTETFINLQRKLVGEAFDLLQETEKARLK